MSASAAPPGWAAAPVSRQKLTFAWCQVADVRRRAPDRGASGDHL